MDKFSQLLKALLSKAAGATRGVGTAGAAAAPAFGALTILGLGSYGAYKSIVTGSNLIKYTRIIYSN
jgi:hypothetical protein